MAIENPEPGDKQRCDSCGKRLLEESPTKPPLCYECFHEWVAAEGDYGPGPAGPWTPDEIRKWLASPWN